MTYLEALEASKDGRIRRECWPLSGWICFCSESHHWQDEHDAHTLFFSTYKVCTDWLPYVEPTVTRKVKDSPRTGLVSKEAAEKAVKAVNNRKEKLPSEQIKDDDKFIKLEDKLYYLPNIYLVGGVYRCPNKFHSFKINGVIPVYYGEKEKAEAAREDLIARWMKAVGE